MIEKRSALRGLQRFTYDAEHRLIEVHNDLNGLPEQLTEPDEHKVWSATYRVWGSTLEEVREPDYIEEQNLRFQGQYLDRETGLHHNIFRFYDPDIGRFTTPDPIGLAGGLNLYLYSTNPLTWIDPYGLNPKDLVRYKPKDSVTPKAGGRGTAINRAWGEERGGGKGAGDQHRSGFVALSPVCERSKGRAGDPPRGDSATHPPHARSPAPLPPPRFRYGAPLRSKG